MTTTNIAVTGMHCTSCGMLIDEALEDLPGVHSASTNLRAGVTTVNYDPGLLDTAGLTAEIAKLGYGASVC